MNPCPTVSELHRLASQGKWLDGRRGRERRTDSATAYRNPLPPLPQFRSRRHATLRSCTGNTAHSPRPGRGTFISWEDAAFWRDRLSEAVRRLGERLREVKAAEEQARRQAAYAAAVAERDKLAAELAELYPPLAEKLADLASRVARNDAEIERVNQRSPDGAPWIAGAELIARQLSSFFDGTADVPRIANHMRLPAFRYAAHDPYSWPPARR